MVRKIKIKTDRKQLRQGQLGTIERMNELAKVRDRQVAEGDLEGQIETLREDFRIAPASLRAVVARTLWPRLILAGHGDDEETWQVMQADNGADARIEDLMHLAHANYDHDRPEQALRLVQRARRLEPDADDLLMMEASCLLRLGSLAAARRRLLGHLERHPDDSRTLASLAFVCSRLRQYSEAADHAAHVRAETLPPNLLAEFHFNAGVACHSTRRWQEALGHLEAAADLPGTNRDMIRFLLIETSAHLGLRDRFAQLCAAVWTDSESRRAAVFVVAYGRMALGEPGQALEALREVFPAGPADCRHDERFAYFIAASRALSLASRAAELRQLMVEFDRLIGDRPWATRDIGWSVLLGLEDRWEEALAYARRARYLAAVATSWKDDAEAQFALCEREVALREARRWAEEGPALQREVEALRREAEQLRRRMAQSSDPPREPAASDATEHESPSAPTPVAAAAAAAGASRIVEARAEIRRVFGPADVVLPEQVRRMLVEAEMAYRVATDVGFAASAVAGLYSSALEEALFSCVANRFDVRLSHDDRARMLRDGRIPGPAGHTGPYRTRFLAWLDRGRHDRRAPGLGEIGLALDDRMRPEMAPFRRFLDNDFPDSDAFWSTVVTFLALTKRRYRDAVRHRDTLSLRIEEVRPYRVALLERLGDGLRGLLPELYRRGFMK